MMEYRVSVTNRAIDDMSSTAEWYGEKEPDLGRRWHNGAEAAINSLAENPERCGLAHETYDLEFDLHELLYGVGRKKTHRILFRINEQTVEVLAVRHTAQSDFSIGDV